MLGHDVMSRLEGASALDGLADGLAAVVSRLAPTGPVKDLLSGTWLGHPLHPLLVAVPIGSWVGAHVLDVAGEARAAERLVALGVVAAVPTAVTGASDWVDTSEGERRVGVVHAALNWTAIGLYGASWLARRRDRRATGLALSALGAVAVGASGWLGGHLSYSLGVGVDTTAFQHGPHEWVPVADAGDLEGRPLLGVEVAGVAIVVARADDGGLVALADRCTHRGGPLSQGDRRDGCVTCPWHASVFALADGSVVRGPATHPQPRYEARVQGGRIEVRQEQSNRALRENPIGAG